jgi:hypothetical protein
MIRRMAQVLGASSLGMAVLFMMTTLPAAYGADLLQGNIPFAFQVGQKTLPAGEYAIKINRDEGAVIVRNLAPKGPEALEAILTYLASPAHFTAKDADIVFDKVGNDYVLSELWRPGADGVLLHATKGPHEHRVHHFKP